MIRNLDLETLNMGIWSEDGTVWIPKALYPKRTEAKMFAVEHMAHCYIDVRVRTRWMVYAPHDAFDERPYHITDKDDPGAFECWEIT